MNYLLSFKNSSVAMKVMNKLHNKGLNVRVVPTPQAIEKGCGLSLIVIDYDKLNDICIQNNEYIVYQIINHNGKKEYKQ